MNFGKKKVKLPLSMSSFNHDLKIKSIMKPILNQNQSILKRETPPIKSAEPLESGRTLRHDNCSILTTNVNLEGAHNQIDAFIDKKLSGQQDSSKSIKKGPLVNFNTEGISSIQSLALDNHIYREGGDSPMKLARVAKYEISPKNITYKKIPESQRKIEKGMTNITNQKS